MQTADKLQEALTIPDVGDVYEDLVTEVIAQGDEQLTELANWYPIKDGQGFEDALLEHELLVYNTMTRTAGEIHETFLEVNERIMQVAIFPDTAKDLLDKACHVEDMSIGKTIVNRWNGPEYFRRALSWRYDFHVLDKVLSTDAKLGNWQGERSAIEMSASKIGRPAIDYAFGLRMYEGILEGRDLRGIVEEICDGATTLAQQRAIQAGIAHVVLEKARSLPDEESSRKVIYEATTDYVAAEMLIDNIGGTIYTLPQQPYPPVVDTPTKTSGGGVVLDLDEWRRARLG